MVEAADAKTMAEYPLPVGVDLDDMYASDRRRILIVEDDPDTTALLKHVLRVAGFDVMSAQDGREALEKHNQRPPDMILLDLMMPEMDGYEMLNQLRRTSSIPVVVVSALSNRDSIVRLLEDGVDDYITKPFHIDEVIARINAVLRRARPQQENNLLSFSGIGLTIDLKSKEVWVAGQPVTLTSREFGILAVLANHAPALVRYETIAQVVWGKDSPKARQRIKYLVYLLRHKFSKVLPDRQLIINIGRQGYKLLTE